MNDTTKIFIMILILGFSIGMAIGLNVGFDRGMKLSDFNCKDTGVPIIHEKVFNMTINLSRGDFVEQRSDNNDN